MRLFPRALTVVLFAMLVPAASGALDTTRAGDEPADAVPIWSEDGSYLGLGGPARAAGGLVYPLDISEATKGVDDVPLRPADPQTPNTCVGAINDTTEFDTSVWFTLASNNGASARLEEDTFVVIDTLQSTLSLGSPDAGKEGYAIAIYEGEGVSSATLRWCEAHNIGPMAQVEFVAKAGVKYFVEVAAINGSRARDLRLSIRYRDVQAPGIRFGPATGSFQLDDLEPGATTEFRIEPTARDFDLASGLASVEWNVVIGKRDLTSEPDRQCGPRELVAPLRRPGGTCVYEDVPRRILRVRWPLSKLGFDATVRVTVRDMAGNERVREFPTRIRDRVPPKLLGLPLVTRTGTDLRASAACSEAGRLRVSLERTGRTPRVRYVAVARTTRGTVRFKAVGPGLITLVFRCSDRAKNVSESYHKWWAQS